MTTPSTSADRSHANPPNEPGLPLPALETRSRRCLSSLHYVMTRIDTSGRLAERSALRTMGWSSRHRLAIRTHGDLVIATSDAAGPHHITKHGHLRLAADIRHRCHIAPGDFLLVAASPDRKILVIYPQGALDAALRSLDTNVWAAFE